MRSIASVFLGKPVHHRLRVRLKFLTATLLAMLSFGTIAHHAGARETWAQRLGYPADRPVLILNAEGMGMCYEVNAAGKKNLEQGRVQSVAVMPPCPWFGDFADWIRKQDNVDVGLLITLNSPWHRYRWPVLSERSKAPGLVDPDGYAWSSVLQVALNATPEEVEQEIRAQIDRARAAGIRPTHLKTYLGALVARADFFGAYLKVARENWLPAGIVELTPELVDRFRRQGFPLDDALIEMVNNYPLPKLDDLRFVPVAESYELKRDATVTMLKALKPGLTEILFLPAVQSDALKHMTDEWQQNVWEDKLLSDEKVLATLKEIGAVFTSWREIMQRFDGRGGKTSGDTNP